MIRAASVDDAPALALVEAAAADHPWSEDQLRETLASEAGRAWLVGEPVVGHLLMSTAGPTADILTIAVHPSQRRQGLARQLLAHASKRLAAEAVEELFLEVRTDNHGAIALYEHTGFQRVGTRRRYYRDGCDALILSRTIEG